ncbi:LPS export ABC transporter ATP-binding protein [soil metagenome]
MTEDLADTVLSGRGIRVERGDKVLLREVDIEVRAGEILGVLGPSGAGKSTLFRALTGEEIPQSGTVVLRDRDVTRWPLWRRARAGIGYVPQGPSVLFDLTVRENLETFAKLAMTDGKAKKMADRVNLGERLDVRAGQLSAGERRRLEMARALVTKPVVLICDEPFAGVDPVGATHLAELLLRLAKEGVAVVLADHHVAEALRICDRAALLLDGAIAVEDEPVAFQAHPLVQGRYLGTWTRSIPPPPT